MLNENGESAMLRIQVENVIITCFCPENQHLTDGIVSHEPGGLFTRLRTKILV